MLVPKIHYPGGKDGILSRFSFWGSVLLTSGTALKKSVPWLTKVKIQASMFLRAIFV